MKPKSSKISLTKSKKTEVVVVLPYVKNKILMQLRDAKSGISFPGHWGFFGGSVNDGETPDKAARRELFEEIGYKPKRIYKFYTDRIPELGNCISYAYCCPLTVPLKGIKLSEGIDMGLFSIEEVRMKKLYSPKMKEMFPVIKIPHLINTIKALFEFVNATSNF